MSMARAIKAGEAFVEATVRDKTDPGIKSVQGKLKAFAKTTALIGAGVTAVGAAFEGLGAAILAPLGMSARHFESVGSELHDMSMRTGVATDTLSELKFAAEQSGASLSDVGAAIRTMQKNGFSADKFDEIAAGIAAIKDPTEQTIAALKVFGKSGAKLLPMIKELGALRSEARRLGLTVDPQDAAAADALGDAFGKVSDVLKDLKFEIGAALAAPLTQAAEAIATLLATVARWISANRGLVVTIAAVGIAAMVIGGVLIGIGGAFIAVASAVAGVAALFTFLATPIGIAIVAISAVTFALLAGAAGWLIFTESGRQAASDFGTFMGGMFDAIASGDLLNAWGQLAMGMQTVWLQMVSVCKGAFWELQKFATGIVSGMLRQVAGALGEIEALTGASLGSNMLTGAANSFDIGVNINAANSMGATDNAITGAQAALEALRAMAGAARAKQLADAAAGTSAAASATEAPGGSVGTFSSAAAGLLGRAGGPLERTAKATEMVAKLIEQLKGGVTEVKDAIEDLPDELETGVVFE
jgi:hypothetical protein